MPAPSTFEAVVREGRSRLYPSLSNPNWLVLRARRQIFQHSVDRLSGERLDVLDVGGRLQPYRELLGSRVRRYVAIDPHITGLVSVAAAGEALPFRDGQFDFVICTQVLEYFPEPQQAVKEIWRVMRKGGLAFVSAPAIFVRDHEQEYWRFLPAGLRHLFAKFESVEVFPEGNSVQGFIRTANVFLVAFARPLILAKIFQWTVVPCMNLAGVVAGKLGGHNDAFSANFSVWACK